MVILEFAAQDGGVILARVAEQEADGPALRGGGRTAAALEHAETTFEAALGTIGVVAHGVLQQLSRLAQTPDEARVEFGLELNAKAGTILAAAGTTAQLKVELTWRPSGAATHR